MLVEVRTEVRPPWPFRLPSAGMDRVARRRGGVLERLLHVDGVPVRLRAAQPAAHRVVLGAAVDPADVPGGGPAARAAAEEGLARWRAALRPDLDLRAFHDRFRDDPWIGRSLRAAPGLRPHVRPEPFEALAWAVTEQLIEYRRAVEIQRAILRRHGRRCARTGLVDLPDAGWFGGRSPAELERCGLAHARSRALVRVAREVAAGRADLRSSDHEAGWRRLRRLPGIGSWTIGILAVHGQGRLDVLPAGDLGYRVLVTRMRGGGELATEAEVLDAFARFAPWCGLAGLHALRSSGALPAGLGSEGAPAVRRLAA